MKNKVDLYFGLGILMFCMLCMPASAGHSYEGYPLETIKYGTGEVYISCGDYAGLSSYVSPTTPHTYLTNFTDVPTENIEWAELKFGVWGGNQTYTGWANTTLSNATSDIVIGNQILSTTASYPPVLGCGNGCWLVCYDCTDDLIDLSSSTINLTVDTNQISSGFDGRVYGAVLIVVYNNSSSSQYWVNQGNVNLHKNVSTLGTYYPDLDANITWFNGQVNESLENATLTVGYLAGDDDQKDYLYFNPPDEEGSPYDLSEFNWEIDNYEEEQLDGDNIAKETCDELNFATKNFDLHTFEVTNLNSSNNYAVFWRGHGNPGDPEIYDPSWPGVNSDTESYLSPFLAVLQITP